MIVAVRMCAAVFTAACSAGIWIVARNYQGLTRPDAPYSGEIIYGLCLLVLAGLIPVAILGRMSGWSRSISFAAMALAVVVDMGLYLQARTNDLETKIQAVVLGGSGLVSCTVLTLLFGPRPGRPGNS